MELTRDQFKILADPIKHYLEEAGMDELQAGITAGNIVSRQEQALDRILRKVKEQARSGAAADILSLANELGSIDPEMRGAAEIKAHHYFNAIHKVGGLSGR